MTTAGFTFNGLDLGALYGLYLEHRKLALVPQTRDRSVFVPGRAGTFDFGTDLGERQITLQCWMTQTTRAALETAFSGVAQSFDPTNEVGTDRGYKQLIFDSLSDRYYLAKLTGVPIPDIVVSSATVMIALRCADPLAYSVTVFAPTNAGSPLSVTPSGNYKTRPVIELTCGNTYSGNIVFTNAVSGEALTWNGSVVNTDIIKVEMDTYRVRKNGALAMSGLAASSVFWPLYAGTANSISVTGPTVTQIKATYQSRWL